MSAQTGNKTPDSTPAEAPRRGPGRPKGLPKTGGRPKGSKNRRTILGQEYLKGHAPKAKRRLAELIQHDDPEISFKAVSLVLAYNFGKPTERKELSGADGGPMLLDFLRGLPG